jgi:hypothetical protein
MKRFIAFLSCLTLIITMQFSASSAAIKLNVSFVTDFYYDDGVVGVDPSSTCLINSQCAANNRKKANSVIKLASTKASFNAGCKKQEDTYLGARVKVTSASGATAGLGNLNSVLASNIRWEVSIENTADWDSDVDYPYENEEDDPTYSEGGYEYVFFTANCVYSGNVTLIKSNAYTIYIDGARGPEYSYAELVKKKWKVTLTDN